VTFLFTDVEGSTALLDELGNDAYAGALVEHRRLVRRAFQIHRGIEIDTQGDAFFVVFGSAREAAAAAADAQTALAGGPIRVRMGMHTGEALLTDQGYVGMDVHRAARVAAVAHGGQVLLSRTTRDLLDQSVAVTDLGEHRLKDLSAPERLYQLGTERFPSPRSLYQTNLPIPATPFLGRETELLEVGGLLAREDVRLVTLTGTGGTGKTRLALQAAAAASGSYPDGVWWVPLASVRDPALVLETAREALGARTDLSEQIRDRSLLLLLDNFEQVAEAAGGVGSLLAACPNLDVLVTSREPLHLGGEHEYAVPTLRHDEAVALFAARAGAVNRSFQQSAEVAEICRRLDDLPLALELAAARVKALSPAQILERLDRRLPFLAGGPRDAPARQRTLRATIAWSHDLLSAEEQRLLARLSVFSGGFALDAAEEVAEADLDTLQSLVDKSLLRHGMERYWMLETIREFADEELARTGEHDSISARHTDFFVALAERAALAFDTPEEGRWIEALTRDNDNLRAALARTAGSPRQLQLACALWKLWLRRGQHDEGWIWLRAALASRGDARTSVVARGLRAASVFARVEGDFDTAEQLADESISIARSIGDRGLEMHSLYSLAVLVQMRGEFARSANLLTQVETIGSEAGDRHVVAVVRATRAYLALQTRDFERALTLATEALDSSHAIGEPTNAVTAGLNLALAANALGDLQTARHALLEAIDLTGALGHRPFLIDSLIITAAVVLKSNGRAALELLAAAERGRSELTIELGPVERELAASVANSFHEVGINGRSDAAATDELETVLDRATVTARRTLIALGGPSRGSSRAASPASS
jgi:predicted ATPase